MLHTPPLITELLLGQHGYPLVESQQLFAALLLLMQYLTRPVHDHWVCVELFLTFRSLQRLQRLWLNLEAFLLVHRLILVGVVAVKALIKEATVVQAERITQRRVDAALIPRVLYHVMALI